MPAVMKQFFRHTIFLMFPQRVLGVVSKMDAEGADPARARKLLEEMGVTGKIFFVSSLTGLGIKSLKDYLLSQTI
jgi:ethanolamine utilization protein EutP (predicted NTPase)